MEKKVRRVTAIRFNIGDVGVGGGGDNKRADGKGGWSASPGCCADVSELA